MRPPFHLVDGRRGLIWKKNGLNVIVEKFESAQAFIKALEEYIDYYNNKGIKFRLKRKESGAIPNPFLLTG